MKYILLETLVLLFQIGVMVFALVRHLPCCITIFAALAAIFVVALLIDMIVKQCSINLR